MQTIIEKPKLKMSEAQKVALFCGLFILLEVTSNSPQETLYKLL